ncbi:ABC transporter permease [Pseudaminobacter soli (ex Zhang et al. 2022)]|uniref:ABC transporter permease n=1 Tax=Pseudaminobacter soli (ex Zhang et al. 2022) TaxID=2831468 RepID=UPI003080A276
MFESFLQATILVSVAAATIRIATPLLLAALGELVAERSGVYNMGLEGMMLMGAFIGYLSAHQSGSLWVGVAAAGLTGAAMAAVFAFMVITLKVEQIVTGLAVNLLGAGLSTYWLRAAFSDSGQTPVIPFFENVPIPVLSQLPVVGPILFDQKLLTYFAFLMVPAVWFLLFRTRYGLIIRCAGDNPKALDVKGVSVAAVQYAAVVFGGLMAGLGGAFLSVGSAARFVPDMTNGRGWLAIIIVIAGLWRPYAVLAATLVFSFLDALQLQIQGIGIAIPYQLLLMMPYVVAIIALMVRRSRANAPAMLGMPYSRE